MGFHLFGGVFLKISWFVRGGGSEFSEGAVLKVTGISMDWVWVCEAVRSR